MVSVSLVMATVGVALSPLVASPLFRARWCNQRPKREKGRDRKAYRKF